MTLMAGRRLGAYEIVGLIGAGGMGEVYRALDTRLGREVAIKVLPGPLAADPSALARFESEARVVAALSHPNILALYDFGSDGGVAYAVLELLDGEALRARLAGGALPVRKALDYAAQTARGIAAAHEKGIVHRDLKPDNIMITRDGRAKVLDFGLAKALAPLPGASAAETREASGTAPGTVMGTVGYMSPEQVRGLEVDYRTDIFSLGVVLYEMLSGRRPFVGESRVETLNAILKEDPPELAVAGASVPAALDRIVRRCLEKSPDERFHSAHDLGIALEAVSGLTVDSGASKAVTPPHRVRLARWVAAGAALAALGGMVFVGSRGTAPPGALDAPRYQRLTFAQGHVTSAQFTADGKTVVYAGHFVGAQGSRLFTTRPEGPESAQLPFEDADVVAMSRGSEMGLVEKRRVVRNFAAVGTLTRASLAGGASRAVLDDVQDADWLPDGSGFVVSHYVGDRYRVEFPVGHVVYETGGYASDIRVSPDGSRVAFMDHPILGDDRGFVAIVDRAGDARKLTSEYSSLQGLAWTPTGAEIWFTASRTGSARALEAVSLDGRVRVVASVPGNLRICDIAPDGGVLLWSGETRLGLAGRAAGELDDRDLSWLDWSTFVAIASDGRAVLFTEMGEGGGPGYSVYLRSIKGSAPIRLGSGAALALSPDGKWALVQRITPAPAQLLLLPTGAGEPRVVTNDGLNHLTGAFTDSGTQVVFAATEPGHSPRMYVQDLSGGVPRPITPEGVMGRLSPDGTVVVANRQLHPVDGGAPRPVPGLQPNDTVVGWGPDARTIFVSRLTDVGDREVYRVDTGTGARALLRVVVKRPGWEGIGLVQVTPDGSASVYVYSVNQSSLYLATGLR